MADHSTPAAVDGDAVKRLLPWLVAIAFFLEALDATILNTAVPAVAAAMRVAPLDMKAVLSSYMLSVAVFIPVSGWLADRYGTRRVFSAAIAIFTTGSLLCGISTDIHTLVASLVAVQFIPDHAGSGAAGMIHGIHLAFIVLWCLTILSMLVFAELKGNDGESVSRHQKQVDKPVEG